ncbi:conserved hypothetical protein [Altererythrobacter sp. B11]|uniref:universal stress protein n=1 Tax=Altererythrobacter sp. B11 TaxID=2060312 RepID=UPI000DC7011F|nr:universal stress protein [Altererythrobacter sp. B11]BBC73916.1 conserved hypothetical protein [Altererythrobacter sp. B11]
MRSILLKIEDDTCLEARLQAALDLARGFGGHVTCLQTIALDIVMPGDLNGIYVSEIVPVLRRKAAELRALIEPRLAAEDVAWDWVVDEGAALGCLLRRSALSDVVVLGSLEPFGGAASDLAADVVLHSRTPVLLVPPGTTGFACDGPVVVAWNGSPEASRALKSALPLLARAGSVVLASVLGKEGAGNQGLPAIEGAAYLSRHGIECEMTEFPREGRSVAQVLADAATLRHASCLVMGAYGHARLIETIWGGVTKELFARPPLPILACH